MSHPTLSDQLLALFEPASILTAAASAYFTRLAAALSHPLPLLLHPITALHTIRAEAFSAFWTRFTQPPATPTPESELTGSASLLPQLMRRAHGTVLELGPGSGSNVRWYAGNDAVTKIYGAEPATDLHDRLCAEVAHWGLEDKYEVVAVGPDAEDVSRALDVPAEVCAVFDTVFCARVLCSVPEPGRTVRELQRLLRPGGQLLVVEHVVNPVFVRDARERRVGSVMARVMQGFYQAVGWSFFVGGCRLTRDTCGVIDEVGGWQDAEIERWFAWGCLPYIRGVWTKAVEGTQKPAA